MEYSIVLADPPWSFRDKAHAGERGVEYHYPSMDLKTIKGLNIQSICAEDAALFLWVPWSMINDGMDVMKSWGFTYKTVAFVWVKLQQDTALMRPVVGMGHWTRQSTEPLLVGRRGKIKRASASVNQTVFAPRPNGREHHSRKPEIIHDLIVRLMGDLPRVELFSRVSRGGWDVIGNEIDGRDIVDVVGLREEDEGQIWTFKSRNDVCASETRVSCCGKKQRGSQR